MGCWGSGLSAECIAALVGEHDVKLAVFPDDLLVTAVRRQAVDGLGELSLRCAMTATGHDSYSEFRERSAPWSRVSIEAVLRARGA
jgi:hypothetical protein